MNILSRFFSYCKVASVNVEVQRISKRRRLYQLHFITRKAAHLKKLQGNNIRRKFFNDTSLASFQIGDRVTQCLFRLNLNKAKIGQNSGLEKLVKGKEKIIELKMIFIRYCQNFLGKALLFFQNFYVMQKFVDRLRISTVIKSSNTPFFIDEHEIFCVYHIERAGISLAFGRYI